MSETPTPDQPNWYRLNDGHWHHIVITDEGIYIDSFLYHRKDL